MWWSSRPTEPQYSRDIMFVVRSIENASPAAGHFISFQKNYLVKQKTPVLLA